MTYSETLNFLFSQLPMYQRQGAAAYKNDLNNTQLLDAYFNHPHKSFKTIHVAGTNGKGSVSHITASILQEAGFKVGLYTSPHLLDFRERIKINGEDIPKKYVVEFVENHRKIIDETSPSFFEMTVAMAFKYFADENIDIAVVEVGMGGRLDSTNIITPIVSIITNIGLDHTKFLGNTTEKIAIEKAGIIKQGVPVVIGELNEESKSVFSEKAEQQNAPIYFAPKMFTVKKAEIKEKGQLILLENNKSNLPIEINIDLQGNYQKENVQTVMAAMQVIAPKFNISEECIAKGFANVVKNTGIKGRWQIIKNNPKVICDTGHNKEGVSKIVEQLLQQKYDCLHIVFGAVNDKDYQAVLSLMPTNALYYFTKASIPRALNPELLKSSADKLGFQSQVFENVEEAYKSALLKAKPNDLVFIGGSTFIVADFLLQNS